MVVFGNQYFKPGILLILTVSIPSQFPAEEGGEGTHVDIVFEVVGEGECLTLRGVVWFEDGVELAWIDDGIAWWGFGGWLQGVLLLTASLTDAVFK